MRKKESKIAKSIDKDFRKSIVGKEISQFRDRFCSRCINQYTTLCEIRRTEKKELKCINYEVKNENSNR